MALLQEAEYSRFTLKRIQRCRDEFLEASGLQSAQQARKIYSTMPMVFVLY